MSRRLKDTNETCITELEKFGAIDIFYLLWNNLVIIQRDVIYLQITQTVSQTATKN